MYAKKLTVDMFLKAMSQSAYKMLYWIVLKADSANGQYEQCES